MPRIPAVLETSFWIAAYRAEVAANCLDLYAIVVPPAVEAEIVSVQPSAPRREFPYSTLFRHLRPQLLDPPQLVPAPLPVFGPGEAQPIPLARELGASLLINERRAATYAANLGIQVISVPAVVLDLHADGVISKRAARTKLALIEPITSPALIAAARRALDTL
jgi:predicted nucleic acid-binding protein